MKKTLFLTLMAAALLWIMPSCKPTEDPQSHLTDNVVVTTAEPSFITSGTATCGAEVTADNVGLLIEIGVCWSKSANPTIDDFISKSPRCSTPFVCMLTNLEPNTQYHVRGYVQYGTEYRYGNEMTFTTLDSNAPAASPVTTLPAHDISYSSAICDIAVEHFGLTNWYAGVCISQVPEFTYYDCEYSEIAYLEDDVYRSYFYGLSPNTQYYYRAFVKYYDGYDDSGFFYGDILSFTTPDMPLVINLETYDAYYSWGGNYIHVSGSMYCSKPEVIDQIGFCYSTTNVYPQYESDLHTTVASTTGSWYDFQSNIFDISANTKYYLRSYVRYMTDSIQYGNVMSVDTY